ncbi:MAG: AAA family ATPase [Bacteroidota bacterium]|nr:AAA family ATPase [Bacteroidota bacterium]
MKKVLVLGCCGAGKSTFSKKLHSILKLELIHLDKYYHKPNWEEPEKTEWEKTVNSLVEKPSWIMDGNFSETMDIRIKNADTIIYLDYPTLKCFWRVLLRLFKHNGRVRSDMATGCKEQLDLEFLYFVLTFNSKNRKETLKRLGSAKENKRVYIFKSDKEADLFLLKNRNCRTGFAKH